MDIVSGLRSELFRPFAVYIVPGSIAVAPFIILSRHYFTSIATFGKEFPSLIVAIIIVSVVAAGLILEAVGARIECWLDKIVNRRFPDSKMQWGEYLSLYLNDEIVGQRYLRTVVMHMKFELSCAPALVAHAIGLVWINHIDAMAFEKLSVWWVVLPILLVAVYLLWESLSSARVAAITRAIIIKASVAKQTPIACQLPQDSS